MAKIDRDVTPINEEQQDRSRAHRQNVVSLPPHAFLPQLSSVDNRRQGRHPLAGKITSRSLAVGFIVFVVAILLLALVFTG